MLQTAENHTNALVQGMLFDRSKTSTHRIPSLAVSANGVVLAIAQHRKGGSRGDFGHDSDIVLRRSLDGGRSWEQRQVLATEKGVDFHNGPIVVDKEAGRVVVCYRKWSARFKGHKHYRNALQNNRKKWEEWGLGTYVIHSDDDGASWSEPRLVKIEREHVLTEVRCGNGTNGIQLADGRLAVQAAYDLPPESGQEQHIRSMLWLSADHGMTWEAGPEWDNTFGVCENSICQLQNGRVYVAQRTTGPHRATTIVDPASGQVLEERMEQSLPEPVCHASVLALGDGRLVFSNPSIANPAKINTRQKLVVRLSTDDGKTWKHSRLLEPGLAGYSALASVDDETLLCIYETGSDRYDDAIAFARFPISWVTAAA